MTNKKTILDALEALKKTNFPYIEGLIFAFIGGSQLHGAKLESNDDMDIYGVFIEPPERSLGLDCFEHFVTSTAGNERRNGPEDVDITLYSLRRWAELAAKGNPTALHFLFANENTYQTPAWVDTSRQRTAFLAKKHVAHFRGFADSQLKRLYGEKGNGKHGQRPEIVEKFGYDTKAGMHVIRLLGEAIELMQEGYITLPRPNKELLINIRKGEWSMDRLLNEANLLFQELANAEAASYLPKTVDRTKISAIISDVYLDWYNGVYEKEGKGWDKVG